jgi:hypothetical protein
VKYDSDGNFIFGKSYGSASFDEPASVTAYPNGDVLVSGQFGGTVDFDQGSPENELTSLGAYDNVLVRYNSTGDIVWLKQLESQAALAYGIFALKFDSQFNIILTGNFSGTEDFDPDSNNEVQLTSLNNGHDAYVLKLNPTGEFLWVNHFSGSGFEYGRSLTVDHLDNMFVGGIYSGDLSEELSNSETFTSTANGGTSDGFVWKVDSNGGSEYVSVFGGPETDYINAIQFNDNHLIIAGSYNASVDFNPGEEVFNLSTDGSEANTFILSLEADDSLSLDDFDFNQTIQLYPNPSTDTFYITGLLNTIGCEIVIHNTLGQIISSNMKRNESSYSFEIKDSKGVYFVTLFNKDNKQIKTFKVLKL